MLFEEILAGVYEDCNYQSSPAAAVATRLKRYVNEGYRAVLSEPGLARLVDTDGPYTFSSVADQARYVLPNAYAQIRLMTDRANDRKLDFLSLSDYRTIAPDPTASSGTPEAWVPLGRVAVSKQPSDASELFAKSTSGSDTQELYIEGIQASGDFRKTSVTLNGATAVSLNTGITDWIEVTKLYLGSAAAGVVTLHEDSGVGTQLASIFVAQQVPQYTGFYLWPTPSAVVAYTVDARLEHHDLVNGDDEPVVPKDFHPMLIKYAVFREWEHKDDINRATIAFQQYQQWLRKLKYWLLNTGDTVPVASMRWMAARPSRLGAWFPAGT